MMSDSTSPREHKIIDIRSIQVILWKKVEHVKSVHTNGGRDVLLGLGYMAYLGQIFLRVSLVRVPLGNPWVEFHTLTLARG
jgi:hypothetical protein